MLEFGEQGQRDEEEKKMECCLYVNNGWRWKCFDGKSVVVSVFCTRNKHIFVPYIMYLGYVQKQPTDTYLSIYLPLRSIYL